MIAFALAALLSQMPVDADGGSPAMDAGVFESDGGTSLTVPASFYSECVEAPPLVKTDGGFFMPQLRAERNACMLATCEASYVIETNNRPGWVPWVIGVAASIGAGIAIGWCAGTDCLKAKP